MKLKLAKYFVAGIVVLALIWGFFGWCSSTEFIVQNDTNAKQIAFYLNGSKLHRFNLGPGTNALYLREHILYEADEIHISESSSVIHRQPFELDRMPNSYVYRVRFQIQKDQAYVTPKISWRSRPSIRPLHWK